MVIRQPFDPNTGQKNDLLRMVNKLGIDKEKIKFDPVEEEFQPFPQVAMP